jgi:PBSX family phage terminase large subunit
MMSEKQLDIMAFSYTKYDALICDGAIRSGKTSIMTVAFVDWAMREFDKCNFAICSKTVGTALKNVVRPLLSLAYARKRYSMTLRRSDNMIVIKNGKTENYFYIYGGKDESSYMLIQGITLAGVFLDEVALMTRSFVEQALARCSVSGSKFWFNCNPEGPFHWFYLEWVLKAAEKNALHLHFDIDDNPSLSDDIKKRYKTQYSGVFYDRYIRGLWVKAEGLIYPGFSRQYHVTSDIPGINRYYGYYVSMDYGTLNPCSMGLWCVANGKAYRIKEFYYDGRAEAAQKTDEEYYTELEKITQGYPIDRVIIDPSAASFKECIRRHGKFSVYDAVNDVVDGIRVVSSFLKSGKLLISESCVDAIREFSEYCWDEKSGEDKPIKEHDHAMDDIRYFCNTVLKRELRWEDWSV